MKTNMHLLKDVFKNFEKKFNEEIRNKIGLNIFKNHITNEIEYIK